MFVDCCMFPFPDDAAQRPIRRQRQGCQSNGSETDENALPYLIGKASPIVWYITLCNRTYATTNKNPTKSIYAL